MQYVLFFGTAAVIVAVAVGRFGFQLRAAYRTRGEVSGRELLALLLELAPMIGFAGWTAAVGVWGIGLVGQSVALNAATFGAIFLCFVARAAILWWDANEQMRQLRGEEPKSPGDDPPG